MKTFILRFHVAVARVSVGLFNRLISDTKTELINALSPICSLSISLQKKILDDFDSIQAEVKDRNIMNGSPLDKTDEVKILATVSLVMVPRIHYLLTDFTPTTTSITTTTSTITTTSMRETSSVATSTLTTKTTTTASSTATVTSTIILTTTRTIFCSDGNKYCDYWAKTGECQKNPGYMTQACRKSCGLCGSSNFDPISTTCRDKNQFCSAWTQQGYCQTNPAYMDVNCCASCRGGPTHSICRDQNPYCISWAYQGD